jgi:hypothetical protein
LGANVDVSTRVLLWSNNWIVVPVVGSQSGFAADVMDGSVKKTAANRMNITILLHTFI